jgi:hypothetical protein
MPYIPAFLMIVLLAGAVAGIISTAIGLPINHPIYAVIGASIFFTCVYSILKLAYNAGSTSQE